MFSAGFMLLISDEPILVWVNDSFCSGYGVVGYFAVFISDTFHCIIKFFFINRKFFINFQKSSNGRFN